LMSLTLMAFGEYGGRADGRTDERTDGRNSSLHALGTLKVGVVSFASSIDYFLKHL